jgi:ADP-ribose pyrophosphatase YjhB (NUDIX family)
VKITQSAGGVVLNPKGEVLVVNQNGNSWSLPKGHLDAGEDALSAARREIYEESGIQDLEFVTQLGSYERPRISLKGGDDVSEIKRITLFLFRTERVRLSPIDPANPEARWVKKEEVAKLLTHPKDKEFFLGLISTIEIETDPS